MADLRREEIVYDWSALINGANGKAEQVFSAARDITHSVSRPVSTPLHRNRSYGPAGKGETRRPRPGPVRHARPADFCDQRPTLPIGLCG